MKVLDVSVCSIGTQIVIHLDEPVSEVTRIESGESMRWDKLAERFKLDYSIKGEFEGVDIKEESNGFGIQAQLSYRDKK